MTASEYRFFTDHPMDASTVARIQNSTIVPDPPEPVPTTWYGRLGQAARKSLGRGWNEIELQNSIGGGEGLGPAGIDTYGARKAEERIQRHYQPSAVT